MTLTASSAAEDRRLMAEWEAAMAKPGSYVVVKPDATYGSSIREITRRIGDTQRQRDAEIQRGRPTDANIQTDWVRLKSKAGRPYAVDPADWAWVKSKVADYQREAREYAIDAAVREVLQGIGPAGANLADAYARSALPLPLWLRERVLIAWRRAHP